jgi:multisubunit Na+/H+ antiporter MnhB subunit
MDLSRLRPGELVAGAGGVALLVVMFLDWYGAGGSTQLGDAEIELSVGFNAWQAFDLADVILALVALSAIALAVLSATQRSPALPVAASVITSTLGILGTLLVFYRILNQPGPNELVEVKLGAFLGFLSVAAVAVGGWLSMRDEEAAYAGAPVTMRPAPPATEPEERA